MLPRCPRSITHFEQFLAVCRASILAEALRIGAQFSSKPRAKRGVSVRRTRTPLDRLQPTTNSDKLIDTDKHNTPLKRFAQERRTTDTDDSLPLCFLPHTPAHLCYDERVHEQVGAREGAQL